MVNQDKVLLQLDRMLLKDAEKIALIENFINSLGKQDKYKRHWYYTSFKNQLVRKRKQLGYEVGHVAKILKISEESYILFEEGKQRLSAKLIVKLMDLFNVQIWELTGGKDPNQPILEEIEKLKAKVEELENKLSDK